MNTTYILIGACFLLNLIVVLAFRAADKKDKSFKKVNAQIKNFRNESTAFMNRFNDIARDAEQNITARIDHANTVQNHLAESIDMVLVHQKELDDLSSVCENYGNALKKLKTQTEQAENRVYAVQAEVRKTEAVKDYVAQFQKDVQRLTQDLESLKADYVRLVASTEQELKTTAMSQKEENRELLNQFGTLIERSKAQLSEYVATEKRNYDDMCREQETIAEAQLEKIQEKQDELENHFLELNKKIENATVELESAINSTENTLEAKLKDKEDDIEASISSYQERLQNEEKAADERIKDLRSNMDEVSLNIQKLFENEREESEKNLQDLLDERTKAVEDIENVLGQKKSDVEATLSSLDEHKSKIQGDFDLYIQEKSKDFDEEAKRLEDNRAIYTERCKVALEDALSEINRNAQVSFQKIRDNSEEFLKSVGERLSESEKAHKVMEELAYGKVKEAEEILNDYSNKIKESETSLNEQVELVTNMKETIWNLQQNERGLKEELDALYQDRDKLQDETREVKNRRLNEEANLVRLKGQQKVVEEQKRNEEKTIEKEKKAQKHRIEEMDVIIGEEEEVDVSDDD